MLGWIFHDLNNFAVTLLLLIAVIAGGDGIRRGTGRCNAVTRAGRPCRNSVAGARRCSAGHRTGVEWDALMIVSVVGLAAYLWASHPL